MRCSMTRLHPFFSYFGAKWRLAPKYPQPLHETIVEPFAGSACYALQHHAKQVVLVEANDKVASIWQFLVAATPDQVRALPLVGPGQAIASLDVPEGARNLIGFWMARGASTPKTRPTAWMTKHAEKYPGCFWGERVRERIASQVDAIKHWEVVLGDYSEAPDVEATWFVDPPYQGAGVFYAHGASLLDYEELGCWCRMRLGQVIACENLGAQWLPFEPFATVSGCKTSEKRKKRTTEVLWHSS